MYMTASKISSGSVLYRGEKLPTASCALFPNQKKSLCFCRWRSIEILSPVLYTSAPKYVRVRRLDGAGHFTGRLVNTAVRRVALDAISIRSAIVCVPLLLCADCRQRTDCAVPSLMLKPGNTPYPCPASEANAPVFHTWLAK